MQSGPLALFLGERTACRSPPFTSTVILYHGRGTPSLPSAVPPCLSVCLAGCLGCLFVCRPASSLPSSLPPSLARALSLSPQRRPASQLCSRRHQSHCGFARKLKVLTLCAQIASACGLGETNIALKIGSKPGGTKNV